MKALLFGLAALAVGAGIVVWAVKRSIDFDNIPLNTSDPASGGDDMETVKVAMMRIEVEKHLSGRGEPWWPLWGTRGPTN